MINSRWFYYLCFSVSVRKLSDRMVVSMIVMAACNSNNSNMVYRIQTRDKINMDICDILYDDLFVD